MKLCGLTTVLRLLQFDYKHSHHAFATTTTTCCIWARAHANDPSGKQLIENLQRLNGSMVLHNRQVYLSQITNLSFGSRLNRMA